MPILISICILSLSCLFPFVTKSSTAHMKTSIEIEMKKRIIKIEIEKKPKSMLVACTEQ